MAASTALPPLMLASTELVVVLVTIVFAVNNREPSKLDFWPLFEITLPLYGLVLLGLLFGFLIGVSASWLAAGKWRRLARVRKRELELQASEVAELKNPGEQPAIEAEGARKPAPGDPNL